MSKLRSSKKSDDRTSCLFDIKQKFKNLILVPIFSNMKRFVSISGLCIINVILVYQLTRNHHVYDHPHYSNEISCYGSSEGDALKDYNTVVAKDAKNIFFIETSCRGDLDSRQACSIESAARLHPERSINILFTGPVKKQALDSGALLKLSNFPNVKIARINLADAVAGTPLEWIITHGLLQQSEHKVSHTSDILRFLLLWKFGGIYMDLDVITLRSFNALADDFTGLESSNYSVAAGVVGLSKSNIGRKVAEMVVKDLSVNFKPYGWGHNGPSVLERAVKRICKTEDLSLMNVERCQGFQVYNQAVFYPINVTDWKKVISPVFQDLHLSFAVHLWNKNLHRIKIPKKSLYMRLAKLSCPGIFKKYGENFGI